MLLTLKSAINWKDCYKNLLYTATDFSNWLGPKAQWIDFCDFTTDEDFLMYSYNPFEINKDTSDVTLLWYQDFITQRGTTPSFFRRPTASQNNFYRDCLALDDSMISKFNPILYYYLEILGSFMTLFNVKLADYLPVMAPDTDIGTETVTDSPIINGKADQGYYGEEDVKNYN